MSDYKFSVKIYVEADTTPTDTSIGLDTGVFFWTLGQFDNVASEFVNGKGILTRDGISSIQKSVNVKRNGDIANVDGLSLSIDNTDKFWVKFITAFGDNVSLHGSRVEITEYSNNENNVELIFQGTCDLPSFSKSTYKIPIRSLSDSRDSQLGVDITDEYQQITINGVTENVTDPEAIGKIVPLSFGKLDKASFLKTGGEEELLYLGEDGDKKVVFPTTLGGSNDVRVLIKTANSPSTDGFAELNDLIQNTNFCYLKIVGGTGEGQVVLLDSVATYNTDELTLGFANNIYTSLIASDSLVSFVRLSGEYDADFWICGGVKNEDGQDVVSGADIYTFNEGFNLLPNISLDVDASDTEKNSLIQNPSFFEDGSNKLKGFQFVQTDKVANSSDDWWLDIPSQWVWDSAFRGFKRTDLLGGSLDSTQNAGDTRLIDGSDPFEWVGRMGTPITGTDNVAKIVEIPIPTEIPDSFDSVYFIIHAVSDYEYKVNSGAQLNIRVKTQKWYDDLQLLFTHDNPVLDAPYRAVNYPLSYDTIGLNNATQDDFWTSADNNNGVTGYQQFDLGVSTPDELRNLFKVGVIFGYDSIQTLDFDLTIKSAGFVFVNSADISKNVYTRFNGRLYDKDLIFANGWTTNNLINDPMGALAHTKWLQNFTNSLGAVVPSEGWGKAYPTGYEPLNKMQDEVGSYYHSDFSSYGWLDVQLSKQITDRKASSSKAISKDICNKFFTVSWVNQDGLECVSQIAQKSSLVISQTITQSDMISWGDRIEQDSRDIFCEPIVNYDYNVASKGYNQSVAITQTGVALATESLQANAVKGLDYLSESARASLWLRARALYTYYGVINEAPKVLSDNSWISEKDDAYWYLRKWLRFQGVGIVDGSAKVVPKNYFNFSVRYDVGASWDIGTRINVNVPNLTDSVDYEALIYSISRNVSASPPTIDVKVILFDLDIVEESDIQDSFDDALTTWQDSTSTLANNIQDEV